MQIYRYAHKRNTGRFIGTTHIVYIKQLKDLTFAYISKERKNYR